VVAGPEDEVGFFAFCFFFSFLLHSTSTSTFKDRGLYPFWRRVSRFDLGGWRSDRYDPARWRTIRRSARTRIALLRIAVWSTAVRPYLEPQAVDVASIEVAWNGILESAKSPTCGWPSEVNVAARHNSTATSVADELHCGAGVRNFGWMESISERTYLEGTIWRQPQ